jgi:hypothetical protein
MHTVPETAAQPLPLIQVDQDQVHQHLDGQPAGYFVCTHKIARPRPSWPAPGRRAGRFPMRGPPPAVARGRRRS